MADLDLDDLVEVTSGTLLEIDWFNVEENDRWAEAARMILSAVLPLALAGARKSLEPFMEVADDYDDLEEDDLQVLVDVDYLAPRLRLKTFRQARSTLSHIDTLIGMADNKGEKADG